MILHHLTVCKYMYWSVIAAAKYILTIVDTHYKTQQIVFIFFYIITSTLRGFVIGDVCPSVGLFVSLFANSIAQKLIDGFSSNFHTFMTYV